MKKKNSEEMVKYCCEKFKKNVEIGMIEYQHDLLDLIDNGWIQHKHMEDIGCSEQDVLNNCPFCKKKIFK